MGRGAAGDANGPTCMNQPSLLTAEQYQASCHARFETLLPVLSAAWPGLLRIEHIGASAIPGAVSKGDLDLCLVVPAAELEAAGAALRSRQGYVEKTGTLRTEALCMLVPAEPCDPAQDHALQLVAAGSRFERLFIGFRDALRADPALLADYNALKLQHWPQGEAAYRQAKGEFVQMVLDLRAPG